MSKTIVRFALVTLLFVVVTVAYFAAKQPCYAGNCAQQQKSGESFEQRIVTVSATEFSKRLSETKNANILDVRTREEFLSGHLINAVNYDVSDTQFRQNLSELDRSVEWFVYCRSGNRSRQAVMVMKELGFHTVTELQGGILSWNGEVVQ